jgi:hypothetical protein
VAGHDCFTELLCVSIPTDDPGPFTDRLLLAVAADLARFRGLLPVPHRGQPEPHTYPSEVPGQALGPPEAARSACCSGGGVAPGHPRATMRG